MKVFCGHPAKRVAPSLRSWEMDSRTTQRPLGYGDEFTPELTWGASPGNLSQALFSRERHQGAESSQVRRARQVKKLGQEQSLR